MRGVLISVLHVPAQALKRMSVTGTEFSAFAATLRGVSRVDIADSHTETLRLANAGARHHAVEPLRQLSVGAAAARSIFADLLNAQILEDKYRAFRGPLTKLRRSLSTKRLATIGLFTSQPFEGSAHGVRIAFICLPDGQLSLKSLAYFTGSLVYNLLA